MSELYAELARLDQQIADLEHIRTRIVNRISEVDANISCRTDFQSGASDRDVIVTATGGVRMQHAMERENPRW